jgi:glucose-6-phosphate isomerase
MKLLAGNSSYIELGEIKKLENQIVSHLSFLRQVLKGDGYSSPESLLALSSDIQMADDVASVVRRLRNARLKYVLVIGIGGSDLGAKAVYDAGFGVFDTLDPQRYPKAIFIETSEPEQLLRVEHLIEHTIMHQDELAVCVISKSGTTTETIINAEVVLFALRKKFGSGITDRIIIITGKGSELARIAMQGGYHVIEYDNVVSGRFSIFSPVGMVPLGLVGIDIDSLRRGANEMRDLCLSEFISENPSALSAIFHYHHYKEGVRISDNFFFHPQLESLGKWYRQLIAESLGKEKNVKGEEVRTGIMPVVSIGTTDLHSVAQLTLGGPKDKITSFIWSEHRERDIDVPSQGRFLELVPGLKNQPVSRVMDAILRGVKIAYDREKLPYIEIMLSGVTPFGLGEYMMHKMIEVMLLGHLFNIHTFDQPNVEVYKEETRKILNSRI